MQTWLDWYVSGSSKTLRRMCEQFPGTIETLDAKLHQRALTDDAFAFRLIVERSRYALSAAASTYAGYPGAKKMASEIVVWGESLAPFCLQTGQAPLAAALDRDVVRELTGTRLSPEVRRYAREAVARHRTVYLDIADRALLFGDALHVGALFVAEVESGLRFTAVFGEVGHKAVRRLTWLEGGDWILTDQHHDENIRKFHAHTGMAVPALRPLTDIARDAGIELREVLEGLENFAYLATTYTLTEMEHAERQPWEMLPYRPANHECRHGRKSSAAAKKFSLFRVWRVSARHLDRGERNSGTGGWKLGHRVRVSGHYRLQPFGPKRSQRRLRWIAQHERGPRDGPPVTPIVRIGAFHHQAAL
ncbi:hypothetical protein [Mesorhizobium sp. B2-4-17]|uniref:hypothetical protein n=1 Tax=Mesorhizobium sp. B2-4-17 TaxID=2589932 RepID=UPI001126C7DD|nr:hypothetical protein [Mesorhizobium sp. B2-4-17]TPK91518.1 hypothetical protein FJ548_04575 [Mesorhizobium sp. B2-4-17]